MTSLDTVIAQGPFKPSWDSLKNFSVPEWYQNAKFGIFIHWGLYSVPAFNNEWYPRNMYREGTEEFKHHIETYGPHTEFGYKDFIPMFKAEKYDPDTWAKLFKQSGARYVVPVAEHHDGFAMYDSSRTKWSAAKMGPKRDLIGELADAVRKQGLVFGVSNHQAEHWWFMGGGRKFPSDVQDDTWRDFYGPAQPEPEGWITADNYSRAWEPIPDAVYLDDWLARLCEIVDKYRPNIVYFDGWIEQAVFQPYLQKFAAFYYNRGIEWGQGVAINYKHHSMAEGTGIYDIERGQLSGIREMFWQTDTAVAKNSWGYVDGLDYKSVNDIVGDLVDIVSKNGALLLNIGPRPDGTIPEGDQEILLGIGAWLAINGEAIYDTRPWHTFGEGPTQVLEGHFTDTKRSAFTGEDIRFTAKDNALYAIALAWPGETIHIKSWGTGSSINADQIGHIQMLGSDESLEWSQDAEGLHINTRSQQPGEHAFTFKLTLN
jgi:alpha-L-fucosidase